MGDMSALSEWLQAELETRGWTQSELSRRSGLSSAMISTVLSGKAAPGIRFCRKVARAAGTSPEKLMHLAGLLPPVPDDTPLVREAVFLLSQLPVDIQEIVLDQLRGLVERRKLVPSIPDGSQAA
jgi:transcriptional regulator with XRE-family HTH domain